MLDVGDSAPEFRLPGSDGEEMSEYGLSDQLADGPVVLAFYAFDFHPSCTQEMCDLRDLEWFGLKDGVSALGISTDRAFSHAAFAAEYGLGFPLLSDSDGTVSEANGALYDEVNGHRRVSKRVVFVVDEAREIPYRWVAGKLPQQPHWLVVQSVLPARP